MQTRDIQQCAMRGESVQNQLVRLHKKVEELRDRKELISQLKGDGIEILNSQREKKAVILWIWCHSKYALEKIQMLHKWNKLRDVFFKTIQPFISEEISIDSQQFKKTVGKFLCIHWS